MIFLSHSYVFVLRESLIKSLKITLKKIVKSILRCQKTINSPKYSFWEKQRFKEWFAHAIALTARVDDNNTHLFSLLSVNRFKRFLLNLRYKTHGKRFIVNCWVMHALSRGLGMITKLTRTQGIVYWRQQRAQWEYVARSRYWIWLGVIIAVVILLWLVNCYWGGKHFRHIWFIAANSLNDFKRRQRLLHGRLNIKHLDKFQSDRIYGLSGINPLLSTIIFRQFKFFGHILLLEKDEAANIYALHDSSLGRGLPPTIIMYPSCQINEAGTYFWLLFELICLLVCQLFVLVSLQIDQRT